MFLIADQKSVRAVLEADIAGQRDCGNLPAFSGQLPDFFYQFVPVFVGQADVADQNIGRVERDDLKGFGG